MPAPTLIPVPHGLSRQNVEIAVLAGITNSHPPTTYDPRQALSDADFESLLQRNFLSRDPGISWNPGTREGDTRYATVDTRGLYLRVGILMHPDQLRLEIVESKNLEQENGRIHRTVLPWIENLTNHIERELLRLEQYGSNPVRNSAAGLR
jgi:hypothetical protein